MEHGTSWLNASLVYLGAAVVAVPLARLLGLGSIIGYLGAGIAIGPWGLGLVTDPQAMLHFAEFGVVLMLFLVGLELEPRRLWALRRPIFGWGSVQLAGSAALMGLTDATMRLEAEKRGLTVQMGYMLRYNPAFELLFQAVREGWLGDVDFSVDIQGITDTYARAQQMRRVTWELQALSSPTADDRRLLSEAHATATQLEAAATARVDLILRCALEAQSIDESLRREDEQAQTAAAREALHRELSTLLYGVGAAPSAEAADSAADRVMARVAGYREIKQQITLARGLPVG